MASRHRLSDEEEAAQTPLRDETWCAASTSSLFATSSAILHTPLSQSGAAKRPVHTRTAMHAATARPSEPQRGPSRVLLTPPRGGSGVVREGSAESSHHNQAADWSGHGRVESMLAAKRERFISSADTQHSIASSSTPPPRSKRAISDDGNAVAQVSAPDAPAYTLSPPDNSGEGEGGLKRAGRHDRLRLSGSTSRCSSSRGAISDSSSSDLIATVAAAMIAAPQGSARPTGTAPTAAGFDDAPATAAQCLVLDDSVDGTAVVSPEQLRRLLDQAAAEAVEPPSPYRRRLITAEVLRDWTGWEDLELVLTTQLRVDAEAMIGVEQVGRHLPRLSSLKLNGSRIPRIRQLGTGFHALKFLWLNSCHLGDLRGLGACCPALAELYVSFNYIADITPVMELSATLEVLDVEGNLLDDAASLGFVLASLPKVTTLALQGNPITCEHQARVRAAYAHAVAEEDVAAGNDVASATTADSATKAPERFTDVLRAWVRCLMPNLQTLNDEPMQQRDDAEAEQQVLLHPSTSATKSSTAAPRMSSARPVHVDPLDERLAEELRLVEACVRETDPFDPLREAVEESNHLLYTRPSTSCNGARPRLTPATAMGASRPSTSARSSAATSRRLGDATPTDASTLTTGAVLAGSATTSLRRRLATPTPTPLTCSLESALTSANKDGEANANFGSTLLTSTRLGDAVSAATEEDEEARVAALLADDSEEDEWENYKLSLLLPASRTSNAEVPQEDEASALRVQRPSLLSLSSAAYAAEAAEGASNGGAALTAEEDGFDTELKSEWRRLRLRMAKAGQA